MSASGLECAASMLNIFKPMPISEVNAVDETSDPTPESPETLEDLQSQLADALIVAGEANQKVESLRRRIALAKDGNAKTTPEAYKFKALKALRENIGGVVMAVLGLVGTGVLVETTRHNRLEDFESEVSAVVGPNRLKDVLKGKTERLKDIVEARTTTFHSPEVQVQIGRPLGITVDFYKDSSTDYDCQTNSDSAQDTASFSATSLPRTNDFYSDTDLASIRPDGTFSLLIDRYDSSNSSFRRGDDSACIQEAQTLDPSHDKSMLIVSDILFTGKIDESNNITDVALSPLVYSGRDDYIAVCEDGTPKIHANFFANHHNETVDDPEVLKNLSEYLQQIRTYQQIYKDRSAHQEVLDQQIEANVPSAEEVKVFTDALNIKRTEYSNDIKASWITQERQQVLAQAFARLAKATGADPQAMANRLAKAQKGKTFKYQHSGRPDNYWGTADTNKVVVTAYTEDQLVQTLFHEILHLMNMLEWEGVRPSQYEEGSDELLLTVAFPSTKPVDTYHPYTILVASLGSDFYSLRLTDPKAYNAMLNWRIKSNTDIFMNSKLGRFIEDFAERWHLPKEKFPQLKEVFEVDLQEGQKRGDYTAVAWNKVEKLKSILKEQGVQWSDFLAQVTPNGSGIFAHWLPYLENNKPGRVCENKN